MTKHSTKLKKITIALLLNFFIISGISIAWATVTYVTPKDVTQPIAQQASKNSIPTEVPAKKRGHAPEPATLLLFGSGFFGIIVNFVRKTYAAAKRLFDILAALLGFTLLGPLMLVTALLVKITSKGPILYSQIRVGKYGKEFRMYKFRSMRVDAEKGTGPVWATKNDNRLSPIGGLIRKVRLDELPQFFNILKGDMSLIGPRPERPKFVEELKQVIPDYEQRLNVQPGLTGLAQVWHRYDENIEDVKKKVIYDLRYIKNMCFAHDFKIAMRTILVVLTGFGAK